MTWILKQQFIKLLLLASQPCVYSHGPCVSGKKLLLEPDSIERAFFWWPLPPYVTEEIFLSKKNSCKYFRKLRPKKLSLQTFTLLGLRAVLVTCCIISRHRGTENKWKHWRISRLLLKSSLVTGSVVNRFRHSFSCKCTHKVGSCGWTWGPGMFSAEQQLVSAKLEKNRWRFRKILVF